MQSKTRRYAEVLFEYMKDASEKEAAKRIQVFKELLKKRGDLKLLTTVLQEFQKLWRDRNGKIAEVVSAKPLSVHTEESFKKQLSKQGFLVEQKIDEKIGAGVAIYLGNEYLIDNTLKARLKRIWQKTF